MSIGSTPSGADQFGVDDALPVAVENRIEITAATLAGLGNLSIATSGPVDIGSALTLGDGGSLSVISPLITIEAPITAHDGTVSLTDQLNSGTLVANADGSDSSVTLSATGGFDLSGVWTNLALDPTDGTNQAYKNGGSLTIDMTGGLSLAAGSSINLNAGGGFSAKSALINAKGGALSLIADDNFGGAANNDALVMGASVSADGVGTGGGGAFTMRAPSVVIGADAATAAATQAAGGVAFAPGFFQSGFGSYDINGVNGMVVEPGTSLAVLSPVYVLNSQSSGIASGASAAQAMSLIIPNLFDSNPAKATLTQRAGASLNLRAEYDTSGGVRGGGALSIGQGASITVDPGQTIGLYAYDTLDVEGALTAHGGAINVINNRIQNAGTQTSSDYSNGLAIWIGSTATLDTSGIALIAQDTSGRSYGNVLAGGSITLGGINSGEVDNTDAQVIIRAGAVLDASGTAATVDQDAGWAAG